MTANARKRFEDLGITRSELDTLKDAFKNEKFLQLMKEYCDEVNDPKNKEIYEKEITQFERERGVDVTFIHPTPGYVIKTSADGNLKVFINVCSNEKVGKPSAKREHEGLHWSLPYLHSKPKEDLDKKRQECDVYDVVFHPDTLYLASRNAEIKKFVDQTALCAVEQFYHVVLDKRNIKFPKLEYKGLQRATVIRKKMKDFESSSEDDFIASLPDCPYKPVDETEPVPTVPKVEIDPGSYTIPKYTIKHRKDFDLQEMTYGRDSQFHAAIPTELVVIIDLPLVKSAADVNLDVTEKTLSLISEAPKYKLDITLPFAVDEGNGTAQFEKNTKKLHVTLPVIRKKITLAEIDSGIESDPSHSLKSSSDEDLSEGSPDLTERSFSPELPNPAEKHCSPELQEEPFLNPNHFYFLPDFTLNLSSNLAITLHVQNIDSSSIHSKFLSPSSFQVKLSSIGEGLFPTHHAFCLEFPNASFQPGSVAWDVDPTSAVMKVAFVKYPSSMEYFVGTSPDDLQSSSKTSEDQQEEGELSRDVLSVDEDNEGLVITLSESVDKTEPSLAEDPKDAEEVAVPSSQAKIDSHRKKKERTLSESAPALHGRRSILKCSRSLSESHADDYSVWSSLDSSDSCPAEESSNGIKKTVRFSDVIIEKVFRPNSSILGQRKKNQRKARNKKRAQERRVSESEASESDFDANLTSETSDLSASETSASDASASDVSDVSETEEGPSKIETIPSSKSHRRRGHKNRRKNASTAKHNRIFLDD